MTVLIIHGIGSALAYLNNVLLARWMGAIDYGRYAYAYSWPLVLAPLATLGLSLGVLRFVPDYLTRKEWGSLTGLVRRSRLITFSAGIGMAVIGILVARLATQSEATYRALLIALLLLPLMATVDLQSQILRASQLLHWSYGLPKLLQPLLLLALIVMLWRFSNLTSAAFLLGAGVVLSFVILLQLIRIRISIPRPKVGGSVRAHYRDWLTVSLPLLLVMVAVTVQSRVDILLIGILRGEVQAGIFNVALTTSNLLSFFLWAVNGIGAPLIGELYAAKDFDSIQHLVRLSTTGLALVAIVGGAALVLAGRWVISLFGYEYLEGYPVLVVLVAVHFVSLMGGPLGYLVNLTGHERAAAKVSSVSAVLNIVLSLVLIKVMGMIGAAVATLVSVVLWNTWLSVMIRDRTGLRTFVFLLPSLRRVSER